MAAELKRQSNRGQAMIEGLCILIVAAPLFYLLLLAMLQAITTLTVDHLLDVHLICMVEQKSNCESETKQKIHDLGWSSISLVQSTEGSKYKIKLNGKTHFGYDVIKQRELFLELQAY